MRGSLLLRADAGFEIGTGHVMRLLALVEAWQTAETEGEPGAVWLLGCVPMPGVRQRLIEAGVIVYDLKETHPDPGDSMALSHLAEVFQPDWIVLDGYRFDADYQAAARALGKPLLVIDDMARHAHYHADLLLNPNVNAEVVRYTTDPDTHLLLGARYCLLRSEIQHAQSETNPTEKTARSPVRLLVTMGGAATQTLIGTALAAIASLGTGWETKVVLGSATHDWGELPGVEILRDVRAMGALMAWADLALSASGTTAWELASLGVPTLLVVVADNQVSVAQAADAAGFSIDLGWWENVSVAQIVYALEQLAADAQKRAAMRAAGRACVDGAGAIRVVQAMRDYRPASF